MTVSTQKQVCYTLDVEEDYAGILRDRYEGLENLSDFLRVCKERRMTISCFVQAKIIERFPEKIEEIEETGFEVHLHSYSHPLKRKNGDWKEIQQSKLVFERHFCRKPIGYRFPQGDIRMKDYEYLRKLGFEFDSSVFPTYRPFYFNNLDKPTTPFTVADVLEIPISVVSESLRIPVSLSYMKLFYPLHFLVNAHQSPIVFDMHLHDLYNLKSAAQLPFLSRLPYLRKSRSGLECFIRYSEKLRREGYRSVPISTVCRNLEVSR